METQTLQLTTEDLGRMLAKLVWTIKEPIPYRVAAQRLFEADGLIAALHDLWGADEWARFRSAFDAEIERLDEER